MDAQEARGSRNKRVSNGLLLTIAEGVKRVALQDFFDGAVVVLAGLLILLGSTSLEEVGQHSRCRVGEHVAVSDMMSCLVGLDDDASHHERSAA